MRRYTLLFFSFFLLFTSSIFGDQITNLEKQVREISDELRCPTCQGLSVKSSEAGLAMIMKKKIRQMLQEGKSRQDVLDHFEGAYGEWILRTPKKTGFNILLWALPGIGLVLAVSVLYTSSKKASKGATANSSELKPLSDEEQKQLDKDLQQLS
ncbi:MAG: cytochrome c-type biogenesis protein CcmH [bacterium]|jgi:cytochrome c-type biogenesis protein CcmH